MSRKIVVLENKVVANKRVEWCVPFNVAEIILILDQQSRERSCERFGSASDLIECMGSERHVGQRCVAIALCVSVSETLHPRLNPKLHTEMNEAQRKQK